MPDSNFRAIRRSSLSRCVFGNLESWNNQTRPNDQRYADLINWTYMSVAMVLCEYHLATGEKWVLPELQEVHDHLAKAQYLHMSQINPKAKKSEKDDLSSSVGLHSSLPGSAVGGVHLRAETNLLRRLLWPANGESHDREAAIFNDFGQ